jgi:hypothetical protein
MQEADEAAGAVHGKIRAGRPGLRLSSPANPCNAWRTLEGKQGHSLAPVPACGLQSSAPSHLHIVIDQGTTWAFLQSDSPPDGPLRSLSESLSGQLKCAFSLSSSDQPSPYTERPLHFATRGRSQA